MIEALLARYGYHKRIWDRPNGHRDSDAVAKAHRWMAFYNEPGGIGEVIESLRLGYFQKASLLSFSKTDELLALSLADRIMSEIDGTIKRIIDTGKIEQPIQEHAAKIAALPEPMRRRL